MKEDAATTIASDIVEDIIIALCKVDHNDIPVPLWW